MGSLFILVPVNQGEQVHVPQPVAYSPRVQALQNEGFLSTSNPTTPQVSPKGTPCHTDDEIEDLPDFTVRTKRFWKRQNSKETQSGKRLSYLIRLCAWELVFNAMMTIYQ